MKKGINPYVEIIVNEAEARGIEVRTYPEIDRGIAKLTLGEHVELINESSLNTLGRVTFKVFLMKALTMEFLKEGGFAIPSTIYTDDIEEIKKMLVEYNKVVVKPVDAVQGRGVTPGITKESQIGSAVKLAVDNSGRQRGGRVLCQNHIDGKEYRLLVIDKKIVYVVERVPAHVIGDGAKSVQELVKEANESAKYGRVINIGDDAKALLGEQDLSVDEVPEAGRAVRLARAANAHLGGHVNDLTDEVSGAVKQRAIDLAKYFDAPVVGIDSISPNIIDDFGVIIELNSTPDLTLHHFPTNGKPRNPAADIVTMLFPESVA